MLLENEIYFEDLIHDKSIINSYSVDISKEEINEFIKSFTHHFIDKNPNDGEITKTLKSLGVNDKFKEMLAELDSKNIQLCDLTEDNLNDFCEILSVTNVDIPMKIKFYEVIQIYKFAEEYLFAISYNKLLNLLFKSELNLSKLIRASLSGDLELFLFLQIIKQLKIEIPDKILEELLKNNNNIIKFKKLLNSNTFNEYFSNEKINAINKVIELNNNCQLRNINFFSLDINFLEYTVFIVWKVKLKLLYCINN